MTEMSLMEMDVPLPVEARIVFPLVHVMDGRYLKIMEFAQQFVEMDS